MYMEQLNEFWKKKTGADLTEKEAWLMVDFIRMLFENADRNLEKELAKQQS